MTVRISGQYSVWLMAARPLAVVPAWRWWTGFFVIVAIGAYMSALADAEGLPAIFAVIPQFDKVVHLVMGGMLAFFLDGALRRRMLFARSKLAVPLSTVMILVPAGIEEYMQRYTTYRTSSFWDFFADFSGVVLFTAL